MLDVARDRPAVTGTHLMVDSGDREDQAARNKATGLLLRMVVGRNHRTGSQLEFNQLGAAAIDQSLALDAGEGTDISFRIGVIHPGLDGR